MHYIMLPYGDLKFAFVLLDITSLFCKATVFNIDVIVMFEEQVTGIKCRKCEFCFTSTSPILKMILVNINLYWVMCLLAYKL